MRAIGGVAILGNLVILATYFMHLAARQREEPGLFGYWQFNANTDRSFLEIFSAVQLGAAAVVLLVLFLQRTGLPVLPAWSLLFTFMAADDLGQLHEGGSWLLSEVFDLPAIPGLRPEDTGELIAWAMVGFVPVALIVLMYRRSSVEARRVSWTLVYLSLFIMAFAIGVDMIDVVLRGYVSQSVTQAFIVLESVGELFGCTLVLVFCFGLVVRHEWVSRADRINERSDATQDA